MDRRSTTDSPTDSPVSAAANSGAGKRLNPVVGVVRGASYLVQGFGLIQRPRLRRYVIFPLAVNIVLFGAVLVGLGWYGGDYLFAQAQETLPSWLDWLAWLVVPVLVLAGFAISFFTFALVANLIASPFNSLLAEAVEIRLSGGSPSLPITVANISKEVAASVANEVRKLLYIVPRMILLLPLWLLVPVVGPALWLLFGAWMLTLSCADYPMGNNGHRFATQRKLLWDQPWLAIGFGLATGAALTVPILNLLVIPAAVAGATAMWVGEWPNEVKRR